MNDWKTTLWGFLTAFVFVIAAAPNLLGFLSPEITQTVTGICSLLAAVFVYMGFKAAKDKEKI